MKTPILMTVLAAALGLSLTTISPTPAQAAEKEACGSEGSLTLICGAEGVEDMLQITGTKWIIGSGLGANGMAGALHLIDSEAKTWSKLYPSPAAKMALDKTDYFKCPGAPDPAKFEAHGIALKQTGANEYQLLAVNHGGRESIEVFNLDTKSGTPVITWIGCVVMPKDIYMNSVTFLPKEGFAFTKFYDTTRPQGIVSIFAGDVSGAVYEWHTQLGITEVPGTDLLGANGIAVSPDGKWLFVAAWGAHEVVRFERGPDALKNGMRKKDVIEVGFSPDNLRWAPDGSILIAGQNSTRDPEAPAPIFKGWTVLKLNPETMKTTKLAEGAPDSILQGVSNAIDVNGTLWLGAYTGPKIGYMPMP